MKKIACLSALAAVLAVSAGTAVAATSTVTGGYAQSDYQGVMNKANGFNLKYRYEQDNNPLGVIGSFTYTEKDRSENGAYNKGQYYGITAGPAYRLNDWASIYGVVGVGYGKFQQTETRAKAALQATATTVSPMAQACSSTQSRTLLWTSPMSRAVSATLTLAPGSRA
ncbi:outer membrane protein X [Enterobacter asburiae]|uniref:Outer membrane protein X n=1 Tax=Enterobacter asburiae TaxID=61645 RepID=A0A376F5X4_ENTAS|nr:outer membrane protein X [Enterobacter asburiae]